MEQKIFNGLLLLLLIVMSCLTSCNTPDRTATAWKPQDGYISNKASAEKVAETVWLNVYGSSIEDNKPFKVTLKGGVWIVEGSFHGSGLGGVPYIEIQKNDGKILKVIHGK